MTTKNFDLLRRQIRSGRELLGMTQTDLAEYMNSSVTRVSNAEAGRTKSHDVLFDLKSSLETLGVNFTRSGVEISFDSMEIIEGDGCYLKLLDDVFLTLKEKTEKNLYIMCASDKVSPPEVNNKYRMMRKFGIIMNQIIDEKDEYILGELNEYRTLKSEYFTNLVTLIYSDKVAQVNGNETRITIRRDKQRALREKLLFKYLWDTGKMPTKTNAIERF